MRHALGLLIAAAIAAGCGVNYTGPARSFDPVELHDDGWIRVAGVPEVRQDGADDCGPAAVEMVLGFWRIAPRLDHLDVPDGGLRARDLRAVLRDHGLRSFVIAGTLDDLAHELAAGRPVIVGTINSVKAAKRRSSFSFQT